MTPRSEALLKRLMATFRPEADDHLRAMEAALLELEKRPGKDRAQALVESVYREAHSLKGAARTVNLVPIETLCGALEDVLGALKHGKIASSPQLFDLLHRTLETIGSILASQGEAGRAALPPGMQELIQQMTEAASREARPAPALTEPASRSPAGTPEPTSRVAEALVLAGAPAPSLPATPAANSDTVRIATAKLDSVLRQAEEMLSAKLAARQRVEEIQQLAALLDRWNRECNQILPEFQAIERCRQAPTSADRFALNRHQLANLHDFLDWNRKQVKAIEGLLAPLANRAESEARALGGMIDSLLRDVKRDMMLPLSSVLEIFPRMIRDLSQAEGKMVEWSALGAELEIDKRVIEEIKDPLLHLVRNCLSHGIEKPDIRVSQGKPPHGTIKLTITQVESNKVGLRVSDDGAGIDLGRVKTAAIRRGIITPQAADDLGDAAAIDLIFQSEVSTSTAVSSLAGRGLGLAIVREKIQRLGGAVSVDSKLGAGTSFHILLPVSLATVRGILVEAGTRTFVVPTAQVERVSRVARGEIKTVENRATVLVGDRPVALVALEHALHLPQRDRTSHEAPFLHFLVVVAAGYRVAFSVARIVCEQEVLVKQPTRVLSRRRNIAGVTILGTGRVVPILNVADLVSAAAQPTAAESADPCAAPAAPQPRSMLVAEDSLTSRLLLQSILESAGYQVHTAVDGLEAWTLLKTRRFDLLVSDVEMPRMDGVALTSKVRADKDLSHLPVVLVTSLETRADRERGVEAGANAYIVKSSFDQSNLLETVRGLLC